MSNKTRGKIKWFNKLKGYGFIEQASGDDLFVHANSIQGDADYVNDGQAVEFVVSRGQKGLQADNVVLL